MPRTSRSVAQRLASQTKSKKRRSPRTGAPAPESTAPSPPPTGPSIGEILDEVVPSAAGPRAAATPTLAPTPASPAANRSPSAARRAAASRLAPKPAPARRRYSEYAAEYAYVWADLRRILIVAGALIVLLVVLSFVLQ